MDTDFDLKGGAAPRLTGYADGSAGFFDCCFYGVESDTTTGDV